MRATRPTPPPMQPEPLDNKWLREFEAACHAYLPKLKTHEQLDEAQQIVRRIITGLLEKADA
jgi:hypothetical protein